MEIQSQFHISPFDNAPEQKRVERAVDAPQKAREKPASPAGLVISPESEEALHSAKQFQKDADFDGATNRSKLAISSYTSFERQSQRESIHQMFGVDIYA